MSQGIHYPGETEQAIKDGVLLPVCTRCEILLTVRTYPIQVRKCVACNGRIFSAKIAGHADPTWLVTDELKEMWATRMKEQHGKIGK